MMSDSSNPNKSSMTIKKIIHSFYDFAKNIIRNLHKPAKEIQIMLTSIP